MQHRTWGSADRQDWDDRSSPRLGLPEERCPECGGAMRGIQRHTGERYLACTDRIECGYQEVV